MEDQVGDTIMEISMQHQVYKTNIAPTSRDLH